MKRLLTFCIILLFVPGLVGISAHAYDYQPVKAAIEVEVTLGGQTIVSNGVTGGYSGVVVWGDRTLTFTGGVLMEVE